MSKRPYRILVGISGSVASTKSPELLHHLLQEAAKTNFLLDVHVIATRAARHFFKTSDLPKKIRLYDEHTEWRSCQQDNPLLHVGLGKSADLMVIAPLSANSLAKITQGICNNLLTCATKAWDMNKPLIFCPAMNTRMWEHPLTASQINVMKQSGFIEVPPIKKTLACGTVGIGGMATVETIVESIFKVASTFK